MAKSFSTKFQGEFKRLFPVYHELHEEMLRGNPHNILSCLKGNLDARLDPRLVGILLDKGEEGIAKLRALVKRDEEIRALLPEAEEIVRLTKIEARGR